MNANRWEETRKTEEEELAKRDKDKDIKWYKEREKERDIYIQGKGYLFF